MSRLLYRIGLLATLFGVVAAVLGTGTVARVGLWLVPLGVGLAIVAVLSAVRPSRVEAVGSGDGRDRE